MTSGFGQSVVATRGQSYVESVRRFADEVLLPVAAERGESEEFAEDVVQQMRELGLFGTLLPAEYGGLGLTLQQHIAVIEEVARGWLSMAGVLNPHVLSSHILVSSGTEDQKRALLPDLASGRRRAAFSLTEPHAGSDVQAICTSARQLEDGSWSLSGHKRWITNGLGADVVLVLAITDPEVPASRGTTCFVVEKTPWVLGEDPDHPGVVVSECIDKMGDRGVETTDLLLDDLRVGPESVVGGPSGIGRGFRQMIVGMETGRVGASAMCVGLAQRSYEVAVDYALRRETFGRPIAEHQAIQFKLADMATRVTAARLMTQDAARVKESGERSDLQAGMAKLFASEAALAVAEDAFRVHGSYGYEKGYEVERLYRDALSLVSAEGPSEIQRMVIGRSWSRKRAKPSAEHHSA